MSGVGMGINGRATRRGDYSALQHHGDTCIDADADTGANACADGVDVAFDVGLSNAAKNQKCCN
jgi:hypothetical protein